MMAYGKPLPRVTADNIPNEQITVGMPVQVVSDDVTPEITLPRFRRAG